MGTIVHEPRDGERLAVGPSEVLIKATGEDTAGSLFLSETTLAPGVDGPPEHVHQTLHDMFYVLEGALTMRIDGETHELQPGAFVCVPPDTPHAISNRGSGPARFLNLATPAGWEHFMRDLAAASSGGERPDQQAVAQIAAQYDWRPA